MQKRKLTLDQSAGLINTGSMLAFPCGESNKWKAAIRDTMSLCLFCLLWMEKTQHLLYIKSISFIVRINNKMWPCQNLYKKDLTLLSKGISLVYIQHRPNNTQKGYQSRWPKYSAYKKSTVFFRNIVPHLPTKEKICNYFAGAFT